MADECDDAQRAEALLLREALSRHRMVEPSDLPSRTHCLDCERAIPEARRLAVPGCARCVACQQAEEDL